MGKIMEIYFDVYGNDNLPQEIDNSVLLNIFKAFNGFPYFVLFPPKIKLKRFIRQSKKNNVHIFHSIYKKMDLFFSSWFSVVTERKTEWMTKNYGKNLGNGFKMNYTLEANAYMQILTPVLSMK